MVNYFLFPYAYLFSFNCFMYNSLTILHEMFSTLYFSIFIELERLLKAKLFGQHIAEFAVPKLLRGFSRNKNPKKALVMSFHGLTGSGKNYISNIIANCTYVKGTGSSYVHIYSGTRDFPHKEQVPKYMVRKFSRFCKKHFYASFLFLSALNKIFFVQESIQDFFSWGPCFDK